MKWWDDLAVKVQQANIDQEKANIYPFDDAEIKQAIVYARQDITLVAVHLSSINAQLSIIKNILIFILMVVAIIAYQHYT